MVFESIVVELVNRYLGSFVDNLDSSQLSIGLWGGDVVLNQLSLKESALDDLDLPVKIKAGHLGKLTLKVPWKSLYTEPVVAQIDGIYALAVPNIGIKYNEEKEKKAAQDEKQAKLAAIEEQKKLEAEKDKPRDPKKDSFVEKLATQVIKNLQVKVSNIHIRYEDKYTNPDRPFSIGVTLQELVFQTTDANWKETVIKEAVTQIYKLIRLDSLSVYWNSKTDLLNDRDSKDILKEMANNILSAQAALSENIPHQGHKTNLQYLFKPISAVAHLRLNTKPELTDFNLPKIFLTLVFDEIAVALSKDQYDDVLEMLESLERMTLLGKYRKSRPDVPYKGNAKKWWHHAYAVTLEHTVRRRRSMWNWNNLKRHRNNLKLYRETYTHKLDSKKLGTKEQEQLKNLENELDVFNICICRNQAEVDVARLGKKREAEKSQNGGWLGGWFGGGKKKQPAGKQGNLAGTDKGGLDLGNKFQEEFNDDEKLKLYKAIGYDESAKDTTTFPVEFVAVRLVTKLNKLSLALVDRRNAVDNQLLKLSLTEICASFGQRPAANAIRLDVKVDKLRTAGLPRKDYTPKIISSIGVSKEESTSLLTLTVETNPLDGLCDSRIRVQSRPLEIVFDAITINALAAFFRPPESVKLKQLSNAAMAKYDEIKTQTAAGVAHMMSERKYADIDVHLMPSYVIVPETGELKKDVNMLLLNLGSLHVSSEKNKEVPVGAQLSPEELASYAYDKFNISLENVQLLFVQSGVNWQEENKSASSPLYILRPMSLQLLLEKCLFANDPNLPQIRVGGELPLVSVAISDSKLLAIMKLAQSIPTPEPAPEPKVVEFEEETISSAARAQNVDLTKISQAQSLIQQTTEYTNLTQLSLSFVIKEVSLEIREAIDGMESPFLKLIVTRIGANVKARSFDLSVDAYLGGIYLQQLQYKISPNIQEQLKKCEVITGEIVNIINSPSVDESAPLLSVQFVQADKKGPEFKSSYGNTAQSIIVAFSALDVVLHQGVILSLLDFAKKLEPPATSGPVSSSDSVAKKRLSITSTSSRRSLAPVPSDTTRRAKPPSDILQLKLKALVESIQLSICNANCVILHSKVEGIEVGLGMQEHRMDVTALMKKIELIDPDPLTFHPKIFSVHGTEMFKFEMTQFKDGTEGKRFEDVNSVDIAVSLQLGRSRIVFVNKFVTSLVNFLDNFSIAKAKLDEAGQAMKEASKDVAKNLQEKAPRVKLDVTVSAPLLVVPQNSKSGDVIMINLGDIVVRNTFQRGNVEAKTSKNNVWVAENMTVTLTNLRLSRGVLRDVHGSIAAEVSVLEPMTFKVDIQRNLSTAYFHGIPDVEVKGVLETIDIKLNQEDVRLLLLITSENLEERNPDSPPAIKDKEKPAVEEKASHADPSLATILEDSTEEPEKSTEVHSTLKVNFELRNINIELYRGLVNMTDAATAARLPEKLLTYLALKTLGVKLIMNSDTSMAAAVYLHDISMDDCRTEKVGGITRMIRRTAFKNLTRESLRAREQEDEDNMVIHLTFNQNSTQDKIIDIHICSLYLCVYVEFLMKVAEFFTKAFPEKPTDETPGAVQVKTIQQPKDKDKNKETPSAPKPEMVGSIDLKVKLDKPEIYLIENQMNTQTDSLIVDMALLLRLRMTADVLSVNGGIHGLSLVSCVYGRDDTKQNVLSPVDITVIGNGPQSKDHHVDISMTDFIMTISPSTIRLLSAIAAGMSVPPETESIATKLKDYSNIWSRRQLEDCKYWFTQSGRLLRSEVIDIGSSVDEKSFLQDPSASPSRGELLILSAPVLVLKLEGGVGHQTVPLLIIESSFSTQVHNWSSDMYIECNLSVEIAYSNEKLGVWEPIIEPVMDTSKSVPHKWGISVEVIKNQEELQEDEESNLLPPPKMTINVVAIEPLQLLMTKTCLDVLNQLGQAFNEAYQLREFEGTLGQKIIPFVFKNRLGTELILKKDVTFEPAVGYEPVDLDHFSSGKDAYMVVRSKKVLVAQDSFIRVTQQTDEKRISFQLADSDVKHELSIKQARKRMFTVEKSQIVVNVEAHIGQKVVSFVSMLQVKNHLSVPIEIMYRDERGNVYVGEVASETTFPVPLEAVCSTPGEIFFQPKTQDGRYAVSMEGVSWKGVGENTKVTQISCEATTKDAPAYYFNVLPKLEKIYRENTEELVEQMITFHLQSTVIFHNLLPVSLQVTLEGTTETCIVDAGHHVPLSHASVNQTTLEIVILEYRGQKWKGKKLIRLDVPELSVLTFQAENGAQAAYMDLGLHCKEKDGSFDLTVYSPYWIVNLTDQDIALKEDDKESPLVQEKGSTDIMLFYFRDKTMFGGTAKRKESSSEKKKDKVKEVKKPGKVSLKIADAEWSDKFSMDTVGSSGNVTCKNKALGNSLEVGVKITLASSGLTKIVTFTPFYLLINASTVLLDVRETDKASTWTTLEPGECKGFYPQTVAKEMTIVAKVQDSSLETVPFFLNKAHTTLLKLEDSYGGLNAECQVSESAMITTFKTYKPGMATVLFVNHTTQCTVVIKQIGSSQEGLNLDSLTSQLYTWTDPAGQREVTWSCGEKKNVKSALDQDKIEEFFAQNNIKVYFVSFLDGMQRVVMFTEDLALATVAQEAGELEQADQEINLKIHDMGFSLINNEKLVELAYMGITSSGVIWEEKRKRFKAMKIKDVVVLEQSYQKYLLEIQAGKVKSPTVSLENKMEVDFENMKMIKPNQYIIRRSFEDGIWVQLRKSPHSMQFHAKINRLQFDNQLRQAIFPTILSPLPPPKSVAADSVPKPFVEVSLMTRIHEHSELMQIKYFKVLIQEMNLKIDQGILNELLAMFASDVHTLREKEVAQFKEDVTLTKRELKEEAGVSMQAKRVSFYDYFHISPIKIHVSFSLQGGSMSDTPQANIMGVFLQSVGVVLTDVQDVVFKLGYFERNHSFYNNSQLTSEFIRHYSGQAIKQMYVLVLGLDVLGNPFGLLRGLSEGIEDLFYEPYQGAIQGPEEFAEGLALGVRSLFGHAVGGAAGAVSRITGTLGKGLAALTLDDDYQKKRREQLNKRPATAREGFARGGKGLVMGVFDGVTGIVRKPVEGAKQEGVAGFFKGMGKGLVGVVTRPTSGVVDFASSSLEGIRRITDFTEEIHRLRPPRRFNKDGVIRPYIREEAEGYNLLLETDKGKYVDTDEYITHVKVKEDGKVVFIVTDKRIMLAKRGDIFGAWDTEWVFTYTDLKGAPKRSSKGIEVLLKEKEKKKLFGSNVSKKDVPITDPKLVQDVLGKIAEAMEADKIESRV